MMQRVIEVQQAVLADNDACARALRARFARANVCVVNLLSSPGSGKTTLLEHTLRLLGDHGFRAAALVGDLATDNDARRLARSGAPVRQICTAGTCHLEARMIEEHLRAWNLCALDYLFIENVGNLVCPAGYDLGEQYRVVLLSVTEGEDKPLKYPLAFHAADLALITKVDLADAVGLDRSALYDALEAVHPGIATVETSARSGRGLDAWLAILERWRSRGGAARGRLP